MSSRRDDDDLAALDAIERARALDGECEDIVRVYRDIVCALQLRDAHQDA